MGMIYLKLIESIKILFSNKVKCICVGGHRSWTYLFCGDYHCSTPESSIRLYIVVKNMLANAGDARDVGSIPGLGRSPGVGNGNQLQYSSLRNAMDRGAWHAAMHGVAKNWTITECTHTLVSYTSIKKK